ncbi:MAG: hypothetical protein GKR92_00335 [Gammaproteobacteria bacterium]|nr:MAG: hypothetical protein GKR92_00335 [Gammaproteobacteria bacterium]
MHYPLVPENEEIRLQSKTNMELGALCLIDTKQRKLTDNEIDLLKSTGDQNLINESLNLADSRH